LQDDAEPKSQEHLVQFGRTQDVLDSAAVDKRPQSEQGGRDDEQGKDGVEPQTHRKLVGQKRPHHKKLTVGEVHDADDANRQRQPDRDEGVQARRQNAGDEPLR